MAINATETHFLECTYYKKSQTDEVAYYLVKAIPKGTGAPKVIHVRPNELISCTALKKVLMSHCILYDATKVQHDKNLQLLFKNPLQTL